MASACGEWGVRSVSAWCAILLVAAGCTAQPTVTLEEPSNRADCARIRQLSKAESTGSSKKPPLPDEVRGVSTTVVKRGESKSIGPRESGIGTPDSLVDKLILVAELEGDIEDARDQVRRRAKAQKLKVHQVAATRSNGTMQKFVLTYQGSLRDGSAVVYQCDGTAWLLVEEMLVPEPPRTAHDPLPRCSQIADEFPAEVYRKPTPLADYGEETDDKEGSARTCGVEERGSSSLDGYTYVVMERPAVDPWRHRLEDLDGDPEEFATSECISPAHKRAHRLPGGPKGAVYCAEESSSGTKLSAAAVVDNDYWVGVKLESEIPKDRLLSRTSKILNALTRTS